MHSLGRQPLSAAKAIQIKEDHDLCLILLVQRILVPLEELFLVSMKTCETSKDINLEYPYFHDIRQEKF